MSEPLRGVVVCHGELAEALVEATESISGVTGVLVGRSPTPAAIATRSRSGSTQAVDGQPVGVFVDLPSGSCLFAVAQAAALPRPASKVVTGVNLAMLVDFVFHRVAHSGGGGRSAAIEAGTKAIRVP